MTKWVLWGNSPYPPGIVALAFHVPVMLLSVSILRRSGRTSVAPSAGGTTMSSESHVDQSRAPQESRVVPQEHPASTSRDRLKPQVRPAVIGSIDEAVLIVGALLMLLALVFPGTTEALFRRARSSGLPPTVNCSCDVGSRSAIQALAIGTEVCVVGRVGVAGVTSRRHFSLSFSEAGDDRVFVEAAAYGGPTLSGGVVVEVRGSTDSSRGITVARDGEYYRRCISPAMPE
jgi:hypothetical protein